MSEVGIRQLKQNASSVVARAAAGERLTITDRGRPVARLTGIRDSPVADLIAGGDARPPQRSLQELPAPTVTADASAALSSLRQAERY